MKRPLRRDWQRIRMPDGTLYYMTPISEYFIVQVWRDGSYWRWVACGFAPKGTPMIAKHGTGQTKNEACYYAEQFIPANMEGEQLIWINP